MIAVAPKLDGIPVLVSSFAVGALFPTTIVIAAGAESNPKSSVALKVNESFPVNEPLGS